MTTQNMDTEEQIQTATSDAPVEPSEAEVPGAPVSEPTSAAAPVTYPAEVPPAAEVPSPPEPADTGLSQMERQRLQSLEQQNTQLEQARLQAQTEEQVRQFEEGLVDQGVTEEIARYVSQTFRTQQQQIVQAQTQGHQQLRYYEGQRNAANHYAKEYGVEASSLINFSRPEDMENFAQQQKENSELKGRLSKLEQAQVPSSTYEDGSSTGAGGQSRDTRMQFLAEKAGDWTDAESSEYVKLTQGG